MKTRWWGADGGVGGRSPAAACPLALLASQTFPQNPTPVRLDHQPHGSHSILLTA